MSCVIRRFIGYIKLQSSDIYTRTFCRYFACVCFICIISYTVTASQIDQCSAYTVHSDNCQTTTSTAVSAQAAMSEKVDKSREGALWGAMIADALSMPVHWFYNPDDIKTTYGGWLTGYVAAKKHHPSSILSMSAVDGSGRTGWNSKSKPVIGHVILHDKLKYWQSSDRSTHYHQDIDDKGTYELNDRWKKVQGWQENIGSGWLMATNNFLDIQARVNLMFEAKGIGLAGKSKSRSGMKAGDNTLNACTVRQILKSMQRVDPKVTMNDKELRGHVLADYVKFMTTPGTHNDTYAESFHRSFFKDWVMVEPHPTTADDLTKFVEERYKEKARGSPDSQLVVIGAISPALPWILRNAHKSEDDCARETIEFVKCTHPAPTLIPYIDMYSRLLHAVINGRDLRQEVMRVLSHSELGGPQKRQDVLGLLERAASLPAGSEQRLRAYQRATQMLGSACYIEGAMSSMLFLAHEFADDFEGGVLANANCGGENCHRGAALGALLGANAVNQGKNIPKKLQEGLLAQNEISAIIKQMSTGTAAL